MQHHVTSGRVIVAHGAVLEEHEWWKWAHPECCRRIGIG